MTVTETKFFLCPVAGCGRRVPVVPGTLLGGYHRDRLVAHATSSGDPCLGGTSLAVRLRAPPLETVVDIV